MATKETALLTMKLLEGSPPGGRGRGSSVADRADLLSRVPLFSGLSKRQLRRLGREASDVRYRPGATIVKEGMLGDSFFAIVLGEAEVLRGRRRIARLGPGDFFGEIALLDKGPRSATVASTSKMVAIRVTRAGFNRVIAEQPKVALAVLSEVARRLRGGEKPGP